MNGSIPTSMHDSSNYVESISKKKLCGVKIERASLDSNSVHFSNELRKNAHIFIVFSF